MTRFFEGEETQFPPCIFVQPTLLVNGVGGLKERLAKLSPQRRHIAELIVDLAPHYGINPALGLAVAVTESALDPTAISPKNAMGVMQLIPETAARFSVENAFDPEQNIRGGLAYLRWLLAYFRGNIELVAAAYNAGEGAVERYRGLPPFAETMSYVKRIGSLVEQTTHPYDSALVGPSPILVETESAEPVR
jgi:soluble lytic murein transglycosylase-like protein